MNRSTGTRGTVNSRYLWTICVVIIIVVGANHVLVRGYVDDRWRDIIVECGQRCPSPCPDPCTVPSAGQGEPPYFAGFTLHNSALDNTKKIKKVQIEVRRTPTDGGAYSVVPNSVFEPPPPNTIPPMTFWQPLGNNAPEPIWGVKVRVQVHGEPDWFEAKIDDLGTAGIGYPDVQVDALLDQMLVMESGNPVEKIVLRLWAWYDFADGSPEVDYDDSITP